MRKNIFRPLAAAIAVLMLVSAAGCAGGGTEMQTVEWKDFRITVPVALEKQTDHPGYDILYTSDTLLLSVVRDGFDELKARGYETLTMQLRDYASLAGNENGITFSYDPDGIPRSDYEKNSDGQVSYCHCELRKGADAFWVITMACGAGDRDKYEALIRGWFNSIEVAPFEEVDTGSVVMQEAEWKGLCLSVPADWKQDQVTEDSCTYTGEDGSVEIHCVSFDDIREKGFDPVSFTMEDCARMFAGDREYRVDFDGQLYCDYTVPPCYYHLAGRKTDDAFWTVIFGCQESERDRYEPLFKIWSKSAVLPAGF